ncbi:DUF6297 family protein [Microbacterium sp. p3-SID336]|uniref:DUF6297 family protein n=1 Tax=Microbacterium sp. p3-SID336 TaxID=2916212 RepID=UPI0021A2BAB3|nr:DUF6297 family protein [Microbacterium sp. p3-SID336]MCT1478851.1 DUF6297 family protein [Microbacterium sp. p3-SID336]
MTGRVAAALRIWRARTPRTRGDHAYAVYLILMLALVAAAPLVRAAWVTATSPAVTAALASPAADGAVVALVAGLWAGALLGGRVRGPALRPPFLTHTFATGDLTGAEAFRGPLLRAGAAATALTTAAAGLIALALAGAGRVDLIGAAGFLLTGALVGVITTALWLLGQASPRAAAPSAAGVLGLGALTAAVPLLQPLTPWGWVGLTYPGAGPPFALVALAALTVALCALVPAMLNRLGREELLSQALRWDSAGVRATAMDFGDALAVYQAPPRFGRRLRAVRPLRRHATVMLQRDAIGALRTPGRLVLSLAALAAAGVLLTLASATVAPLWGLGAGAGMLVFAGLGPLTDGLRHAVAVTGDLPLYGISDERLLSEHVLFPLAVSAAVLLAAAVAWAAVTGTPPAALLTAPVLALLAVATRVSSALKGPLPPALLAPMPSPMGDLGAAVRLAWALDGLLLAAVAGAATVALVTLPVLPVAAAVVILGIGLRRWRRRG